MSYRRYVCAISTLSARNCDWITFGIRSLPTPKADSLNQRSLRGQYQRRAEMSGRHRETRSRSPRLFIHGLAIAASEDNAAAGFFMVPYLLTCGERYFADAIPPQTFLDDVGMERAGGWPFCYRR
jgi:hypothetical protein